MSAPVTSPLPTHYIPHGGGPCFFMDWDPPETWTRMGDYLKHFGAEIPEKPKAIVVISAHWEAPEFTVTTGENPPLLFDYYGFPDQTYELKYPAPGAPGLAQKIRALLTKAGIASAEDATRGFDHGVFVPFLLIYPKADIPIVQLSLKKGLDPAEHLACGRALESLRHEGVLIVGSGMSYHNLKALFTKGDLGASRNFDAWLDTTATSPAKIRDAHLTKWEKAPDAKLCHPREEHLLPLMVAAGAAGEDTGQETFRDTVMGHVVSAYGFGLKEKRP